MYFGNIADSELKQYHETVKNNFSMSLSDVLSSDLFKIETIITDTIYKIYPLFYCDTIASTNKNDKILDNKCIICENDTSTRLYFNTETELENVDLGITSLLQVIKDGATIRCYYYNALFLCFDKNSQRVLEGVKVTVDLKAFNGVNYSDEGVSNQDGLVYLPNLMKDNVIFTTGLITAEYNNQIVTVWEVSE